jgi:hypothetical protein
MSNARHARDRYDEDDRHVRHVRQSQPSSRPGGGEWLLAFLVIAVFIAMLLYGVPSLRIKITKDFRELGKNMSGSKTSPSPHASASAPPPHTSKTNDVKVAAHHAKVARHNVNKILTHHGTPQVAAVHHGTLRIADARLAQALATVRRKSVREINGKFVPFSTSTVFGPAPNKDGVVPGFVRVGPSSPVVVSSPGPLVTKISDLDGWWITSESKIVKFHMSDGKISVHVEGHIAPDYDGKSFVLKNKKLIIPGSTQVESWGRVSKNSFILVRTTPSYQEGRVSRTSTVYYRLA